MENPKVGAYLVCFSHSKSMPLVDRLRQGEELGWIYGEIVGREGDESCKDYGLSSERNLEPWKGFELRLLCLGLTFTLSYSQHVLINLFHRQFMSTHSMQGVTWRQSVLSSGKISLVTKYQNVRQ